MSPKEPVHPHHTPAAARQRSRNEPNAAARGGPAHLAAAVQRAGLAPRSLMPADVLRLQRALGNRAVGGLLAHHPNAVSARVGSQARPASVLQRYIQIENTQHTKMLGLLDEFLERTQIHYFGQDSMYHEERDTILARFRVWTGQNKRFDDWSEFIDEVDSFLGERKKSVQPDAAAAIHTALNGAGLAYAIQGSYAARLHGAPVGAGDIDVLVNDLRTAKLAFSAAGFVETGGSYAVSKWQHPNGTDIDLALGSEFGVNIGNSVALGGLSVLNVHEVMLGLVLRPEKRQKEQDALLWLAKHRSGGLTNPQKEAIASKLGLSWENIVQATDAQF
jgi:hypothetical protein